MSKIICSIICKIFNHKWRKRFNILGVHVERKCSRCEEIQEVVCDLETGFTAYLEILDKPSNTAYCHCIIDESENPGNTKNIDSFMYSV